MTKSRLFAVGSSLLALSCSSMAMAQSTASADRGNVEAGSNGSDIIVTATRREESVLKAAVSITAYSQASLDLKGVRNIEDIARMTPGVSLNQGTFGIKYLVVRGLTSSVGATMNGVYIDDTPVQVRSISLANNFYPALFDLERVEVLRGPQGTSFGAGAMGGAIRFISAKPSVDKYSGYARAELATTEGGAPSYELGAATGGPIVEDKIGFRVSGYYRRDGGYIDRVPYVANRGTAKKNANSNITYVGQAALTFKPTETIEITPSVFYQQANRNESPQFWTTRPGAATPLTPNPYPAFTSGEGANSYGHDRAIIYSVKSSVDLGPVSLISNTSVVNRKVHTSDDGTAFFLDLLGQPQSGGLFESTFGVDFRSLIGLHQTQKSFTQELRLQSNGSGRLNYEVGVFYQNSRQEVTEFDTSTNPGGLVGIIPLIPAVNGNIGYALDQSRDKQIAGFAQVDYKLFDKLKLTAGIRYSQLTVDFTNTTGNRLPTDVVAGGHTVDKPWTPKFGAEYQLTDKMMIYSTVSKGFRPGGSNPGANIVNCTADLAAVGLTDIPRSYKSDSVWSYELGAKGRPSRFIEFAGDVFQLDWTDVQRTRTLTGCSQNFIQNLGSARVRGVEAKIVLYPLHGLSIDTNFSYNDAVATSTIPNFVVGTGGAIVRDTKNTVTSGDRFAPKWIISVAADYEATVRDGVVGYGHIQYDYRSGFDAPNENAAFNPLYGRVFTRNFVAARVGARFHGIDASLFVNNLTNSKDELGRLALGAGAANRILQLTYRPRTFGATISYRY
jgi:iron complex outermembrane receptor protein